MPCLVTKLIANTAQFLSLPASVTAAEALSSLTQCLSVTDRHTDIYQDMSHSVEYIEIFEMNCIELIYCVCFSDELTDNIVKTLKVTHLSEIAFYFY